jgi:hypothetical protein
MSAKSPTRDDMRRAEREVGKNIPRAMIGEDNGDVRDVELGEEKE